MGLQGFLAEHCENCAVCRWARENPESLFGRLMTWHGTWCPAWKAWEQTHGKTAASGDPPCAEPRRPSSPSSCPPQA